MRVLLTPAAIIAAATPLLGQAQYRMQIAPSAADSQVAEVCTLAERAPAVVITDASGRGVEGLEVEFRALGGRGDVQQSAESDQFVTVARIQTNSEGIAQLAAWRLGTDPGQYWVIAVAEEVPSDTVEFQALAYGPPQHITVVPGTDNQRATVGTAVARPPAVRITDSLGSAVPGEPVKFSVHEGGGNAQPLTAVNTDERGVARLSHWILGPEPGVNVLTAVSSSLPDRPITLTAWATRECRDTKDRLCGGMTVSAIKTVSGIAVEDEFFDLNTVFPFFRLGRYFLFVMANFDVPLSLDSEAESDGTDARTDSSAFAFANISMNFALPTFGNDERRVFFSAGLTSFNNAEHWAVIGLGSLELSESKLHGSLGRIVLLQRRKTGVEGKADWNLLLEFLLRSSVIDAPVVKNIAIRGSVLVPLAQEAERESRIVLAIPIGDVFHLGR